MDRVINETSVLASAHGDLYGVVIVAPDGRRESVPFTVEGGKIRFSYTADQHGMYSVVLVRKFEE